MNSLVPLLVAVGYIFLLFAIAAWAERNRERIKLAHYRLPAYTLALAVYCTSWTFFGSVGTAVADGINYVPIFLGPILVYLFGSGFLQRVIAAVQTDGATSISDFIGSRFGKSQTVSALVTIIALFGIIPYLALQLRSVGLSFAEISGVHNATVPMLLTSILLAIFAMLFGTRRFEVAGRNDGVLYAVATESIVKLAALLIVALVAVWLYFQAPAEAQSLGAMRFQDIFLQQPVGLEFFTITLVSMGAVVCLPRQFYIGIIEAEKPEDVARARWPFIAYLTLTAVIVVPIALTGLTILPASARPDLFVLDIPLQSHWPSVALVVFLGGFSAATAMVVVETIALSTMVSNDLIAPLLLRSKRFAVGTDFGRTLLIVRRTVMILLLSVALAYGLLVPNGARLSSIGLIAFAAMTQFTPALILAVRGPGQDAQAASVGLITGFALWFYTLFLPTLVDPAWLLSLKGGLLDPNALLGFAGLSPLSHGVIWSLGANILAFALVTVRRVRAPTFSIQMRWAGVRTGQVHNLGDLSDLVERFGGGRAAASSVCADDSDRDRSYTRSEARKSERLIAGIIGAPSARAIMAAALSGTALSVDDVTRLLDDSAQSLQFSKGLLAATLENIDPGVSVIDRNQNLVAWNSRYVDLFNYPAGLVRVGAPIGDLIRHNLWRYENDFSRIEKLTERRLNHMRNGDAHSFQRTYLNGQTLKTVGGPMPDGGYVMCYTDISAEANALIDVERARAELEARVTARTSELQTANTALAHSTREKTRFLAAASHDLLQPIHAARLFSSALAREIPDTAQPLLADVNNSIAAADTLLRTLLDISKLDAGGIVATVAPFEVHRLLDELCASFALQAGQKGLRIRACGAPVIIETDRVLLSSILQNFLSNAVRYTQAGGVVIAVRTLNEAIRIEVYDTGLGIEDEDLALIFREFERLGTNGEAGIGLGLAIVERTAKLLGAQIAVRSVRGTGSRFAISFPASCRVQCASPRPSARAASTA